jgi:UDP-sugar transporter A1/2/3
MKFLSCLLIILYQCNFGWKRFTSELYRGNFINVLDTFKIAVPSGMYAAQNNLLFLALTYLDAPQTQVTYQLKIIFTAVFSVVFLSKKISSKQWFALVLLMAGVALVQYPSGSSSDETNVNLSNKLFGVFVLVVACLSSGFSGVYFELLLKTSTLSLWMRNVQMAFFGMIFSSLAVYLNDGEHISQQGFFQGYNKYVIGVLLLQTYGGLLVACVVKYTDNIIKGFATSISIIVSSVVSYLVFKDFALTPLFISGSSMVLLATFVYGHQSSQMSSQNKQVKKDP